jgi:protoporphyrin/coproporphyrin ferrochelatase
MAADYDAVLLVSFGAPTGPDDVRPFLERVTAGLGVPPERLESVAQHYLVLGGTSPLPAATSALADALSVALADRGVDLPIAIGYRNSAPYVADALRSLHGAGYRRVLALATSAYSSYSGCRQYREDLGVALHDTGLTDELQVDKLRPFWDSPGMASAVSASLGAMLRLVRDDGVADADLRVLFTTHSIPEQMALTSGPDVATTTDDCEYVTQHLEVARRVMADADPAGDLLWSLVFQSRSGPPSRPWLEPDVVDAIRTAGADGARVVVLVPIGFISDHVEVVWDLDIEARGLAGDVRVHRVATAGTAAVFVSGLADLVKEALGRRTVEHRGQWARLCSEACCPNLRSVRPAVPGV